jgi:cytochrome d ubiquinol oxidase subunit II
MLEIIIIILGLSLLLYTILGGADFGAGVIEIFTGEKGKKVIARAIAPVWEANHMWLILAVVILFNGFPEVYSLISMALHIPIMLALLGIVFRGSAFVFRHYDVKVDASHGLYSFFFRFSSIMAPFFLGMVIGATISGRIYLQPEGFYEAYIAPWLNWFCAAMGLFVTSLFTYLSAAFLTGETENEEEKRMYVKYAKGALVATIVAGGLVFTASLFSDVPLTDEFFRSPVSMVMLGLATLLVPVILYSLDKSSPTWVRTLMGVHTTCIIIGWFAIQFPAIIKVQEGSDLTFYNSHAPELVLYYLLVALVVGVLLVFPALYYLFRVFKFGGGESSAVNK